MVFKPEEHLSPERRLAIGARLVNDCMERDMLPLVLLAVRPAPFPGALEIAAITPLEDQELEEVIRLANQLMKHKQINTEGSN